MSTTLRPFEIYLDEVAFENQFSNFTEALLITNTPKQKSLILEAMRRMCEDAFKAQKEICAERARLLKHDGRTKENKVLDNKVYIIGCDNLQIDKYSIRNAPTPTFDNQNKN